jgi:mRNA interferase YafQ
MRKIYFESSFVKDIKSFHKKHYPLDKLDEVMLDEVMLALQKSDGVLNGRFHDHSLSGNLAGYRELHIEKNILLMYKLTDSEIIFVRLGSHDDLFK